jgi:hypothetical protein
MYKVNTMSKEMREEYKKTIRFIMRWILLISLILSSCASHVGVCDAYGNSKSKSKNR